MPELTEDRLLEDLRRYGAATEAAAGRYGVQLSDYPLDATADRWPSRRRGATGGPSAWSVPTASDPTAVDLSDAPPQPPPRRRRGVLLAAAAALVVLVAAATLALSRRTDDSTPVVDTPATTVVPTAEPFDDGTVLLWLPYDAPPQFLGQHADRPLTLYLGRSPTTGCCGGIPAINTSAAFLAGGTLHLVDRSGRLDDTGFSADRVIADRGRGAFYLYGSGVLARYDYSERPPWSQLPDQESLPAWQLPARWQLANDGVGVAAVDGRVILEGTDPTSGIQDLAVWTPATGDLTPIGRAWWVVDATTDPNGTPMVAWIDDDCDRQSAGCGLVVTNLDTMESRTVVRPEHGYIGGGAFSDDGRHLAVFVAGQANMPVNPSADLAVVDIETLEMRVLPGTNVPVGEPYGSAAWTLDNGSVIYHGLSETRVIDVGTGEQRTLPWDITYSMATIP